LLVDQIEQAVELARVSDGKTLSALIWQGGGMVPGKGTLADELLRVAGFRNMSAEYGLKKWDVLPLEYLLNQPPDLVLSLSREEAASDRMLGHPAVRELARKVVFRAYPFRLLSCAGPNLIEATTRLADIRRELVAK
jgi:iron complex transport system substrate-binding protein